jgi:hypothetical protein
MGPWIHPNLRTWNAYYDTASQMLCQQVPPPATATTGTKVSWHYHPAQITHTRRFLAVTKSNTFADAHPETDAIPVTIIRETDTLLRCSLPPTLNSPLLVTAPKPTSTTFKDYVMALPTWEQDLLINATEKPSNAPLYEMLSSQHATLLAVSDGGADIPKNFGSFGWVIGTEHEILWECKGIARGYPMQSYRAEGYGRLSLLSFLTHYILYLDIQTPDDLGITSYCDNQSLLKNEEKFHTRDVDSSSWYTNPDHDVIMTLSALRTKMSFQLASVHVRGHQDKHCEFELLTRPQQLNVLADHLATEVLDELRAADKPTELYPLPACRVYLRDGTGHITSNEKRTLANEFPEYEMRAYLQQRQGWNAHTLDSINWTAYQAAISTLTQLVRTFVVKLSHDWLLVGVREHTHGAPNATCSKCIQPETVRHLYLCHSRTNWRDQFSAKLTKHLKDASTAANLRCTIVEGIQKWFLTGDTNEPDALDPTTQLNWYQVIKGYLPNKWSVTQEQFFRDQGLDSRYYTGEQWTKHLIIFLWAQGHTLWKDRCTTANGPAADRLDNASTRTRQTEQQLMTAAYASSPMMLAIDRRIFDIPLEQRLQGRTSDIAAWTKTMQPAIRTSISEAQNQLLSGHQDIRTYFSETAAPERNTNETLVTAHATTDTTATGRIGTRRTEVRQRPQQPRTQLATSLNNIRRPRYQDIRNFLSRATTAGTTVLETQPATTAPTTTTANIISRCRALRNRMQPSRAQAAQATAEASTNPLDNVIARMRALQTRFNTPRTQETQATTEEPTTPIDTTSSLLRAPRNRHQTARTQPSTTSTDTWRFFPGRTSPS